MSSEKVLVNLLTKFRSEIDEVLINKDDIQSSKISKSLIQQGDLTSREKEILEYIRLNPGITKQQIVDHFGNEGLGDLTSREKEILEYIRLNPGITKQQIVDHFGNEGLRKHSRVTIFKKISYLKKYGLIVVSPDQNNSQIHHLYINNESTLSLLIQDIETFKNAFFVLLNKAKKKYAEFVEEKATDPSSAFDMRSTTMSEHLLHIYRYFIDVYIIRILFNWSHRIEDPQISVKTASIFFNGIKEIQLKLSEAMKEVNKIEDQYDYNEFADLLFYGQHYKISEFLISLFEFFTYWNMEKEIRNILYCLLKL